MKIIVTAEHAGNKLPSYFTANIPSVVLNSHRGYDRGSQELFKLIARSVSDFHKMQTISRLAIDCNRSESNPTLWSNYSRGISPSLKTKLLKQVYLPYRKEITDKIRLHSREDIVLHLSIHSFTPVFKGVKRNLDFGILFDPSREFEKTFSAQLKKNLQQALPKMETAFNKPYKGIEDGLTTYLRAKFNSERYLGIELEVNQRLVKLKGWKAIQQNVNKALKISIEYFEK